MANVKPSKFERYREYALYFTMALALIYAAYWAILGITNTKQTGAVHVVGDILLVVLVASGLLMGLMYTIHLKNEK